MKNRSDYMHLSNDQLLELTNENKQHLLQCKQCQQKLDHLKTLRFNVRNQMENHQAPDQWQKIKDSFEAQQQEKQLHRFTKKVQFWKIASVAIAASFTLVVIWQTFNHHFLIDQYHEQTAQLNLLIKKNNAMQQIINDKLSKSGITNIRTINLQIELDIIDNALQQAYLQKVDTDKKSTLWRQRELILKETLSSISNTTTMKI